MPPLHSGKKTLAFLALFWLVSGHDQAQTLPSQPPKKPTLSESGQLFEQQTKLYGRCTLLATASGVRLKINDKQLVLVCAAPNWQLLLYNIRQKKYFQTDPARWQAPSSMTVALYRGGDSRSLKLGQCEKRNLKGVKALSYKMAGSIEPVDPKAKHHWSEFSLRSGEYWVSADCKLPAKAVEAVQKMYTVPKAPGLPLQLTTTNQRGSVSEEIVLVSVHAVPVSAADFSLPKDFQKTEEQGKLWLDDRTEGVQELID